MAETFDVPTSSPTKYLSLRATSFPRSNWRVGELVSW
jgi:hypothetical protein